MNLAGETQEPRSSEMAEVALQRFGLRDARLRFLRRGFAKEVVRVVSPTEGEFVLRMYGAPPVDPGAAGGAAANLPSTVRLRPQLEWLSALARETDLLVPEPVPTSDGALMDHVSHHPQRPGRYCVLVRWVPGEDRSAAGFSPAEISLLGSYAAGLHNHAQGYLRERAWRHQGPRGAGFPRWPWQRVFGEAVPLWSAGEAHFSAAEMEMFRAVAHRVREDLDRLGKGPEAFGIIHRDLSLSNVVFDGERVGAIDFDLCGIGHYPFDLAVVLLAAGRRSPGQLDQLRESLLEGYERVRALSDAQRESIASFEAIVRVGGVNQRLKRLGSEGTISQARQEDLGFLTDAAGWLRELSRKWKQTVAFPPVLGELWLNECSYMGGTLALL